jgi:ribosome-associated protein
MHAARLLADCNCEDVVVQDLRGLSQITDFHVIVTGTSQRQIHSVTDDLKRLAREEGHTAFGIHGDGASTWVVADFVDVVIHLFDSATRSYYDLESLWAEARRVDWRSATRPGQFAHLLARAAG